MTDIAPMGFDETDFKDGTAEDDARVIGSTDSPDDAGARRGTRGDWQGDDEDDGEDDDGEHGGGEDDDGEDDHG